MLTERELQSWLFKLGIELGVAPRVINCRLLDDSDRETMGLGLMTFDEFRAAANVWHANGGHDYSPKNSKEA